MIVRSIGGGGGGLDTTPPWLSLNVSWSRCVCTNSPECVTQFVSCHDFSLPIKLNVLRSFPFGYISIDRLFVCLSAFLSPHKACPMFLIEFFTRTFHHQHVPQMCLLIKQWHLLTIWYLPYSLSHNLSFSYSEGGLILQNTSKFVQRWHKAIELITSHTVGRRRKE